MEKSKNVPGVPRRCCLEELTIEEKELFDLMRKIESIGGSLKLTRCIVSLSDARDALADHIEGIE